MSRVTESPAYWRSAAEDEVMQDAHGFVWKAMLATIDVDWAGMRVLDAGCNRGGFLRMLCDEHGIAGGRGYDPAAAAIDDARDLAGRRPLRFEVADTVPAGWRNFDRGIQPRGPVRAARSAHARGSDLRSVGAGPLVLRGHGCARRQPAHG